MKKISWKNISLLFVYTAAALLSISDTGFQLLFMQYIGSNTSILLKIALVLLSIKLFTTRYTKKQFFIILPILALSLYNYQISGNIYCFYNILFIASMKDIDYSQLFKVLFFSTFSALLVIGILSFVNIGSAVSITQDFGRGGIETRYCFGLYHPNIWHQAVARCIVFFSLGYERQLKWSHFIGLFLINVVAYYFSVSRTGLLAVSAFLLLMLLYKYAHKLVHHVIVKISLFITTLGGYILYSYLVYDFANNLTVYAQLFDMKLATGRLRHATEYLTQNPIQFFGTRFPNDSTLFDCGFLRMFSESGYLLAGIFFLLLFVLLIKALKNNWGQVISTIVFIFLYSLYEVHPLTRVPYNIVVFYFALLLFPTIQKNFNNENSN